MTLGRLGFVLVNVSVVWLCFVSAGGQYCAKSARARAAALGLRLPGVHRGGADLSKLSPYSALYPRASPPHHPHQHQHHYYNHQLFQNNPGPPTTGYNTLYNPSKDSPRFHPAGYIPPLFSGGDPLNDRQSNFAQVKRVFGPPSLTQPPGRANFAERSSESQRGGLRFASNKYYSGAVDPNGRGVSGFYWMPSPVGAGSEPGMGYPMGERGSRLSGGHSGWTMYARGNDMTGYPFYRLEKR